MQAGSALVFALAVERQQNKLKKITKRSAEKTREGKRAASRKEKRVEGREEPQGIERLGVGLAGWLCSCVRTSCGKK